uniref:Isoaspartyl peptidase/L-asparaginase n=1 Tax=Oryctolagus cuniculus TaxID=9986 RepID=A0A5F9CH61_RABIT
MNPVVVVHGGGAGNISKERKERVRQGIVKAASEGYAVLKAGGSAVDAVEEAVAVLEDDPEFNAGHGSVLNVNGEVEMDASIMDGKDLSTGAVSAVRCIANPVKLARLVMEKTPHCFLTDQGAAQFAAEMGIPEIPGEKLVTERNKKRLEKEKHEKAAQKPDCQKNLGTVGAVALDCKGNVAYATSTGGTINKLVGRVGDSPCVGSGGYADNSIGAVSTTGHGESILKVNLARLTLFHVEQAPLTFLLSHSVQELQQSQVSRSIYKAAQVDAPWTLAKSSFFVCFCRSPGPTWVSVQRPHPNADLVSCAPPICTAISVCLISGSGTVTVTQRMLSHCSQTERVSTRGGTVSPHTRPPVLDRMYQCNAPAVWVPGSMQVHFQSPPTQL